MLGHIGKEKTKILITGSEVDVNHYREVKPWVMNNSVIEVSEENEHLGMIVTGFREEERNVEENLSSGRKSLFCLLGPAFSQQCHLNPALQVHLYRMFTCPIVRSGLCSLAIRPSHCQPLTAFHRKTLRSFLHFSCRSPVPSLHFLLGELPIEARLHRDTFSLFYAIWTNPQTKIFQLTKFLLSTCNDNSRTWAVHVRHLAKMYGLPDPLVMLNGTPPSKDSWKGDINTLITAYHEKQLRDAAATNSKMTWLNVIPSSEMFLPLTKSGNCTLF